MKRTLLLISLSLLLFSCKTTRYNVKETTKTNIETTTDIREETKVFEEIKVSDNIAQLTDELTSIIERIITVRLSAPDALNNQYPTEIVATEREITRGKTVKYDASSQTEQTINTEVQKTDSSTENIKTETEKIDKTTVKKTTPGWILAAVIILCTGFLLFVFLFLKKRRII